MKTIKLHNQTVCFDSYNFESKTELKSFLESEKIKMILENMKQDVIMVLGWDGTILRAIRKHYKKEKAFLPINFWTKWFLLNDKDYISENSEFISRVYPLIDCKVKTEDKKFKSIAFNEIVVKETDCKMVDLDISVNEKQFLNLQWDWLLVSTPAWSTGYNSSLYWPILPHNSNSFVMTYIASWIPKRQVPTIIDSKSNIKINNKNRLNPIWIYADWQEIYKTSNEEIKVEIKKSKYKVKLLIEENYEEIWDNKVLQEQGFGN